MRGCACLVATLLAIAAPATAQQASREEAGRAQAEMLNRVATAVNAYATTIGLDQNYVGYCQVKLNLVGDGHPKDGSIPFGINYNDVSRETLAHQIRARETFERSFMMLCLAEAKNTLRAAAR